MFRGMRKIILHVIEPLISLLDQMGLKEPLWRWVNHTWLWIGGAMMGALAVAWQFYLYIWGFVPFWAVPIFIFMNAAVFISVALLLLWFGIRVVNAWMDARKRVTDEARIKEWAERIAQDCRDMADFHNSLADANELYKPRPDDVLDHREWERSAERKISAKFYARYGGRILANNTLIEQLDIKLPWHFRHSAGDQPRSLIMFHAHISNLLRDGHIEQARSIDDREGFDLIQSLSR